MERLSPCPIRLKTAGGLLPLQPLLPERKTLSPQESQRQYSVSWALRWEGGAWAMKSYDIYKHLEDALFRLSLEPFLQLLPHLHHMQRMLLLHPCGKVLKQLLRLLILLLSDRKSTRLNSSHSSISYAVFC